MIKYIAYCRKSTDEKDKQVLSIEAQIAELKEFAKRENFSVVDFVIEAKTAKCPGREQFNEVLKRIEKDEVQGIISWHPDRLARNSIDGGKIIYLLDTGKLLDLKFPSFWFENTPQVKFMLNIAFGQSKYYVDNLSENVKRGNRQKLRRGEWPGKAPLGYINDSRTKSVQVELEVSKIIKKTFEVFAEGKVSFTQISDYLFRFGIKKGNGKPLKGDRIKGILSNRFYIGILKHKGEYYQGSHEIFISKSLFNQVQKQIERLEKPRKGGRNFVFRGIATCGECGAAITAEIHTKNYPRTRGKVNYIYYRCTKKLKPCSQKYVSEIEFEKQLRIILGSCGLHQGWNKYFDEWIEADEIKSRENIETELKVLREKEQELETKLNRLLDAYLDQVIEPNIYKQKKNELFEEKLKLQEKIAQTEKKGTFWLEPVREFVNCALGAKKIAAAKNNKDELTLMTKKVGSNYSLLDRFLSADLNFAFSALAESGGAARAAPNPSSIPQMVTPHGFEPWYRG